MSWVNYLLSRPGTGGSQRPGRLVSLWSWVAGHHLHVRASEAPGTAGFPPVILVHGVGVSSRYLVPTAARLAPDVPVYAPDLPGFGRSSKPPVALTLEQQADVLAAWMTAAGIDRAAFLGNSAGCEVIVALALRYPDRVERIVLVGPTVDLYARTAAAQLWRFMRTSLKEPRSLWLIVAWDYVECGFRRILRTLQYMLEDRIEEKLPHVTAPTLVVRGSRDPIVSQRWAEEAAALLPDGRLVILPGASHAANYDSPLELVRVVQPFLLAGRHPVTAAAP